MNSKQVGMGPHGWNINISKAAKEVSEKLRNGESPEPDASEIAAVFGTAETPGEKEEKTESEKETENE